MIYMNKANIRKTLLISLTFLIILCWFAVSGQEETDAQILKDYGKAIMQMSSAPKSGTTLEKAKYVFEMYCNLLADNHVKVDNALSKRLESWTWRTLTRNSERADFKCDSHVNNLQDILIGAGLDEGIQIVGDKEYSRFSPNRLMDVNSNHGALVVYDDDGKPYVFDAWYMATIQEGQSMLLQGTDEAVDQMLKTDKLTRKTLYSNAKNSEFNGMSLDAWVKFAKTRGYKLFYADTNPSVYEREIEEIKKLLESNKGKKKSKTPPVNNPSTPVSGKQKDCLLCGGSKDCYFALKPYSAGNEPWKDSGSTEAYARVYREGNTIMAEFHNYPFVDPCGDPNMIKVLPIAGPFVVLTDEGIKRAKELIAKGYPIGGGWAPKATCDGIVYDGMKDELTAIIHIPSGDFTSVCNTNPVKNTKLWELWFRYSTPTS